MTASSRLCTQEHVPSLLPCQVFRNVAFLFSVYHCNFMDILSFFLNPLWWSQSDHPTYISWNPPEKGLCCLKNWLYFKPAGNTQLVARYHGNSRNLNNQLKKSQDLPVFMSKYVYDPVVIFGKLALWLGSHLSQSGGCIELERKTMVLASQIISTYRLFWSGPVPTVFSESLLNGQARCTGLIKWTNRR